MNFRLVLGLSLVFVFFGCLTVQSPPKSPIAVSKNSLFTQAYPDGVLHFTGAVETTSGVMNAGFSITPAGEVIRSLRPEVLPSSLQRNPGGIKPAWSGTNGKMLIAQISDDNHLWVICTMDSDGKNLNFIYTAEPHQAIISPKWSASSGEIYFLLLAEAKSSKSDINDVKLCRISANGKGFTEISTLSSPGTPMMLKLSPDEKRAAIIYFEAPIAYGDAKPTHEYVIHLINPLNGSEQKKIPGLDLAWSPDSKTIAVIKEKSAGIQLMDIATDEVRLLATGTRVPQNIAWKPDESSLAYMSVSGSENDKGLLLQIRFLEDDTVHNVPVKIKGYFSSGLFWTP